MSSLPQGIITTLKDGEGVIKSEKHGELPFDVKENFSDVEFTAEDVNEEVEFTVIAVRRPRTLSGADKLPLGFRVKLLSPQLRSGNRAIRIKRVKEPLLLTICSAAASSASKEDDSQDGDDGVQRLQTTIKSEVGPDLKLDPELYEGVVTQTIIESSVSTSCLLI